MGKEKKIIFLIDDQCPMKILFFKIHVFTTSPTLDSSPNEMHFVLYEKGQQQHIYCFFH